MLCLLGVCGWIGLCSTHLKGPVLPALLGATAASLILAPLILFALCSFTEQIIAARESILDNSKEINDCLADTLAQINTEAYQNVFDVVEVGVGKAVLFFSAVLLLAIVCTITYLIWYCKYGKLQQDS